MSNVLTVTAATQSCTVGLLHVCTSYIQNSFCLYIIMIILSDHLISSNFAVIRPYTSDKFVLSGFKNN